MANEKSTLLPDGIDVVTGGSGFIGSHLVDKLIADGRNVCVIDNFSVGTRRNLERHLGDSKLELIEGDIRDGILLKKHIGKAERVFHFAALADIVPSIENPREYFSSNVDGTFEVLTASHSANIKRFIYAASSSCYGIPDTYPTPESAPIKPQYPYALTKYLGEELVLHWAQVYELPAISLRFFNVYGPRARTSGTYGAVFGVFLAQLLAGEPLTIVGDGSQTRDFTFVSDIVDAILTAAESDASGQIFNVGSGATVSINRLVELLRAQRTINIPKRPGEPDCTFAETSLIRDELGWHPKVSIEEGVQVMLEYINDWADAPVWRPAAIAKATGKWFEYLGKD